MPAALIVAHGAPTDPEPQEQALAALAAEVAAHLPPDWQVTGATLATPGALGMALTRSGPAPLIYPFFMAQGWFTGRELPRRLALAGAEGLRPLPPFGTDPALPALMATAARDGAMAAGIEPGDATLLLAAHGSKIARTSADSTWAMLREMQSRAGFAHVRAGFVEEAPFLDEAAAGLGPAVCLPFFALQAGHVTDDLPRALARADFTGPLLPAIGQHPAAARLIAAALRRATVQAQRDESPDRA